MMKESSLRKTYSMTIQTMNGISSLIRPYLVSKSGSSTKTAKHIASSTLTHVFTEDLGAERGERIETQSMWAMLLVHMGQKLLLLFTTLVLFTLCPVVTCRLQETKEGVKLNAS